MLLISDLPKVYPNASFLFPTGNDEWEAKANTTEENYINLSFLTILTDDVILLSCDVSMINEEMFICLFVYLLACLFLCYACITEQIISVKLPIYSLNESFTRHRSSFYFPYLSKQH